MFSFGHHHLLNRFRIRIFQLHNSKYEHRSLKFWKVQNFNWIRCLMYRSRLFQTVWTDLGFCLLSTLYLQTDWLNKLTALSHLFLAKKLCSWFRKLISTRTKKPTWFCSSRNLLLRTLPSSSNYRFAYVRFSKLMIRIRTNTYLRESCHKTGN